MTTVKLAGWTWALRAVLPLIVVSTAPAQFAGLTSTDDGGALYFASPLRLRGTDQFLWSKIFRIDRNGAALVAQVAKSSPVPPTNAYFLTDPQVSGDGRLLLYRGTLNCGCCSSCFLSEQHSTTLLDTATGQRTLVGANARISRNGRYLASYGSPNVMTRRFELIDRVSSASLFQDQIAPVAVSIAADGTAAIAVNDGLQLITRGVRTTLVAANVAAAAIDDSSSKVVYETRSPRRLFVKDLKSAQTQPLGQADRDSSQPTLSADGQWVTYLSAPAAATQVFFGRLDGGNAKQLTFAPTGIVEATLSGDARTVFAVAADGSLLRIDTAAGTTTTLVGPTPTIGGLQIGALQITSPGSLASLQGAGFDGASISLSISGHTAPILERSANRIVFQVPWEVPAGANSIGIPEGGSPYFEDSAELLLQVFAPQPLLLAPPEPATYTQPIAIHSDWTSLVTDESPAAAGETVHIYLTGGGPVTQPVATGLPAPLEPLSTVTTPFSVSIGGQEVLHVPYFGLAPGLIGVWQMDVTLPPVWSQPYLSMEIAYDSPPPDSYPVRLGLPAIPMKTGGKGIAMRREK